MVRGSLWFRSSYGLEPLGVSAGYTCIVEGLRLQMGKSNKMDVILPMLR